MFLRAKYNDIMFLSIKKNGRVFMTLIELKNRINSKAQLTKNEYIELIKIVDDDKSKKGLFNENKRLRSFFLKNFDKIVDLLPQNERNNAIMLPCKDDDLLSLLIDYSKKYVENYENPSYKVCVDTRVLSKVFEFAYTKQSGKKSIKSSMELQKSVEKNFERMLYLTTIENYSMLLYWLKKSKTVEKFSELFSENVDVFFKSHPELKCKSLFNCSLENVYYLFNGNFRKLFNFLQKRGQAEELFEGVPLGNLKDFPDFKKEILVAMEDLIVNQDITNEHDFSFLMSVLPELGALSYLND